MKNLTLAALVLSANLFSFQAVAQVNTTHDTSNSAQLQPLPVIDARAHHLLAQVVQKYHRAKTFSGTVRMHTKNGPSDLPWARYEVQTQRWNKARIVATEPKGVTTTICDGENVFATYSGAKNQYTKERVDRNDSPVFNFMETLLHRTIEGSLKQLLTGDNLAASLLDPDLQELSLSSASQNSQLATIIVRWNSPAQQASTQVEMKVRRDDLIIEEILLTSAFGDDTFITRETFSNIKLDAPIADSVFQFTPSKGARLVAGFDEPSVTFATSPINFDAKTNSTR